uniref:Putative secreted protein n=1 Tax=Anopheles darlingi TaxID=43151 RepID=A0A2M4DMU2_ANODA
MALSFAHSFSLSLCSQDARAHARAGRLFLMRLFTTNFYGDCREPAPEGCSSKPIGPDRIGVAFETTNGRRKRKRKS